MFQWISNVFGGSGATRNEGIQTPPPLTTGNPEVNFDSAMSISAVWACVRLLSEAVAGLPLDVTNKTNGETIDPTRSDFAKLFDNGKINRYQTKVEFFETVMMFLTLQGNAYIMKQYSGNRLIGLLPLPTNQMEVKLLGDGSVTYHYSHDGGVHVYSSDTIWHLKLFGNGVVGLSPLQYARNSMGLALSSEKHISNTFKNAGKPTGYITTDNVFKKEQREAIRESYSDLIEGNRHRIPIFEAGMQFHQISMNSDDIQLLDTYKFSTEDICRFFGVPSVLVNDTGSGTTWGSGISELIRGFHKFSLKPYLDKIESSMEANLMSSEQRRSMHVRFDLDDLLRASMKDRFETYKQGINSAVMTPNEAREKEGLEPIDSGNILLINGNMISVDEAASQRRDDARQITNPSKPDSNQE